MCSISDVLTMNENAANNMLRKFLDLKKKHPDAILLIQCGDFYVAYNDDAKKVSEILGVVMTNKNDGHGKTLTIAGFPYNALDTYLPKLVRAGHRVAICDELKGR